MASETTTPDPVLVRLVDWAEARGLSREAVAKRLGVSRPAVAGWFLTLEALRRGDAPPRSGRDFRFTNQRVEVQQQIAEILAQPLQLLREESIASELGRQGERARKDPSVSSNIGSEVGAATRTLLGDLAVHSGGQLKQNRHRVAELLEAAPGVAATAVVAVARGSDKGTPYHYQIAILVEPPAEGSDRELHLGRIRADIDELIEDNSLNCYWEYGMEQPSVQIVSRDIDLLFLGSLSVAHLSATRPPRAGTLVRMPDSGPVGRELRIATVVTNPYGGSSSIAGLLALTFGSGYVHPTEAIRAVRADQDRRQGTVTAGRSTYVREGTARDAGFILHQVLHQLERGDLPGAWWVSMEASALANYSPLRDALVRVSGVVIIVHLGSLWRHMAAWRMAGAERRTRLNEGGTGPRVVISSDVVPFRPGAIPSDQELSFLRGQDEEARVWLDRLDQQEQMLVELIRLRRDVVGLPTVAVRLDQLPDAIRCVRFGPSGYTEVFGDDRLGQSIAFADYVDPMMDAWTAAAVEIVDALAEYSGYSDLRELIPTLNDGPVLRAIERRQSDH